MFAFYHSGYFLWSLFFRARRSVMGPFVARSGWRGVFLKDLGQSLGFYWILAQVHCDCQAYVGPHTSSSMDSRRSKFMIPYLQNTGRFQMLWCLRCFPR